MFLFFCTEKKKMASCTVLVVHMLDIIQSSPHTGIITPISAAKKGSS